MKQHLLRISAGVVEFGKLIAAVRHEGLRVGWLRWHPCAEGHLPGLPEELTAAADHGVMRAVSVSSDRVVAVKPLRGQAVLRDVLREHFRGCALVLVEGEVDAPRLSRGDTGWQVTRDSVVLWHGAGDQLATRLRRPRPWQPRRDPVPTID